MFGKLEPARDIGLFTGIASFFLIGYIPVILPKIMFLSYEQEQGLGFGTWVLIPFAIVLSTMVALAAIIILKKDIHILIKIFSIIALILVPAALATLVLL